MANEIDALLQEKRKAIYWGFGFHARQQAICYCDTANSVLHRRELDHKKDDVRSFYSQLTGEVSFGLEPRRLIEEC